jgi:hypothetical protein
MSGFYQKHNMQFDSESEKKAVKFIEVKYGADWRTPIKEWNVALDDGSIYQED